MLPFVKGTMACGGCRMVTKAEKTADARGYPISLACRLS